MLRKLFVSFWAITRDTFLRGFIMQPRRVNAMQRPAIHVAQLTLLGMKRNESVAQQQAVTVHEMEPGAHELN